MFFLEWRRCERGTIQGNVTHQQQVYQSKSIGIVTTSINFVPLRTLYMYSEKLLHQPSSSNKMSDSQSTSTLYSPESSPKSPEATTLKDSSGKACQLPSSSGCSSSSLALPQPPPGVDRATFYLDRITEQMGRPIEEVRKT
jgi:hypothetical protein